MFWLMFFSHITQCTQLQGFPAPSPFIAIATHTISFHLVLLLNTMCSAVTAADVDVELLRLWFVAVRDVSVWFRFRNQWLESCQSWAVLVVTIVWSPQHAFESIYTTTQIYLSYEWYNLLTALSSSFLCLRFATGSDYMVPQIRMKTGDRAYSESL